MLSEWGPVAVVITPMSPPPTEKEQCKHHGYLKFGPPAGPARIKGTASATSSIIRCSLRQLTLRQVPKPLCLSTDVTDFIAVGQIQGRLETSVTVGNLHRLGSMEL